MTNNLISVVFTKALIPSEIQALKLTNRQIGLQLVSVGVWYDREALVYRLSDDIDFWINDDLQMVCKLRVTALYCLPKGLVYGFYIPLLELPVEELVSEIPYWLVEIMPQTIMLAVRNDLVHQIR